MGDLGVTWNVDPVLFHRGTVPVHAYSLLFAASFLGGFALLHWQLARFRVDPVAVAWFVLGAFAAVVVGTRLAHCVFYEPQLCTRTPWAMFDLRGGGLASHGAALLLPVVLWAFARRQRLPVGDMVDAATLPVMLGAGLVRLGNLMNSEILGRTTDVPWGFRFVRWDEGATLRHPAQLYEAVLAAAVFGVLLVVDRRLGTRRPRWLLTGLLLALYFGGRLAVEVFKDEGRLTAWLTTGQVLSLPFAAAGMALLVRLARWRGARADPPAAGVPG